MAVSKVQLDGSTLMTVEDTTAVASDVASGKYFYDASGVRTAGTSTGGYAVLPVSNDTSMGTVSGGGVATGSITVVATPTSSDYKFVNWTVNGTQVSTSASYTFTPTANTLIQANFADNLTIVSWASGTAAQLKKMIDAHYAGKIDITDYWSLGDTRTVTLPAMSATNVGESHASQSVQLVLMDSTCTGFTLTSEQTTPTFIVGMKNCLNETGYMNSLNTNTGGWSSSKRRTWCNNEYKTAMESVMPSIFKQFTWKTGQGGGSSSGLLSCDDYFALTPEKAVFGSRSYSFSDEAALYSQWNWYATSSNRIKTVNGSASYWWEASPYSGDSNAFCSVHSNGGARSSDASYPYGVSPFGCI